MLIYCYKCLKPHRFDNRIQANGKALQCAGCGYSYTLYPSKVIIGDFHEYVFYHTDLRGRARSIIMRNVSSVNHFLKLTRNDFLRFHNCGLKTAFELVEFGETLRRDLGLVSKDKELENKSGQEVTIPAFLKNDIELFEMMVDRLSARGYQMFVCKHQIDSVEKLMALRSENLIRMKNCGYKTIQEISQIQNTITEMVGMIQSSDLGFNDFKSIIKCKPSIRKLLNIDEDVDPQKPFPSLNQWVLNISKNRERNKDVFMQRMGMCGKSSQTYEQIGIKHDISRERVREIVEKLKKNGKKFIYRLRLDPLIEQAEKVVRLLGGKVAFSELINHLLNHGPQGELLKHSVPFIEYLNGFPLWQKAGMNINDGFVYIEPNRDT